MQPNSVEQIKNNALTHVVAAIDVNTVDLETLLSLKLPNYNFRDTLWISLRSSSEEYQDWPADGDVSDAWSFATDAFNYLQILEITANASIISGQ